MKMLLEAGADVTVKEYQWGLTAVEYAMPRVHTVPIALKIKDVDKRKAYFSSAPQYSAHQGA